MQISIGTSMKANCKDAVAEAIAKVNNPNLLILLCSYEHLKEASALISEKYPGVPFIGTSTTSYYDTVSSDKRMVVLSFGSDVAAEVGIIRKLSSAPIADIAAMEEKVSKIQAGDSNTVCIEFCTNDEERLVTTMNVALERAKIPVVGGTIFDLSSRCYRLCHA